MNKRRKPFKIFISAIAIAGLLISCKETKIKSAKSTANTAMPTIQISDNGHYFQTDDGKPFFWLGDTGWLTFKKLDRASIKKYFEDRKEKGYNVIQIMTLHSLEVANFYGDSALVAKDLSKPLVKEGHNFEDKNAYDYWDHIDYALDIARENGLYLAMVPIWGSAIKSGEVSLAQAKIYANFLGERFKDKDNIIWLNGGDTHGDENTEIWNAIGEILKAKNLKRLITFHPFGRTQSSDNFHAKNWLDFNMFQSGHRRYDQETEGKAYAQDNYKYVREDFNLKPTKPTIDGEPSYEGIPQGLHDTLQPLWQAKDLRRYGYWSVFAGAAGFTYGHSAVMQMYSPEETKGAYGNTKLWTDAINDPGGKQMRFIKELLLKYPYFERIPDETLIANQGEKYDYLAAMRGKEYALIYTYTGRTIAVHMNKIKGDISEASWYNPRNGKTTPIGVFKNKGVLEFKALGKIEDGNDWVLQLISKQ
tara:strand:+ start:93336 stop:94763 length:1428 start_codon:yes stop_codon:yes gene_type:complete